MKPPHTAIQYRPEVDGLRAIAVLPVLFFHAGLEIFSGGYVGVDIFFVISGYLITSILLRDLEKDRFSLLTFYDRRIRRIFPALIVVILVTLALAWALMLPKDLVDTGQSAFAASVFASNILFWFKTGYFAGPAESKALLHTWSLAVEEQFYVFFPLVLWAVYRFCRAYLMHVLVMLGIASFAFCMAAMQYDESFAFYMFPTRAWELIIGCLLAIAPARRPLADLFTFIGLVLIGFSIFAYDGDTVFPGLAAIPPVLGTALVIHFAPDARLKHLLSWKPLVWTGLLSYSLYLWHWPVIVFLSYWTIRPLNGAEIALAIVLSFVLAGLTWRFIEQPFRHLRDIKAAKIVIGGLAASAIPALVGLVFVYGSGMPNRVPAEAQIAAKARLYYPTKIDSCTKMDGLTAAWMCRVGNPDAELSFALLGDSHAGSWRAGVDASANRNGTAGLLFTANGCPPVTGAKLRNSTNDCDAYERQAMAAIREAGLTKIILAARWPIYEEPGKLQDGNPSNWLKLIESSTNALAQEFDVHFTLPVPGSKYNVPNAAARKLMFSSDVELSLSREEVDARDANIRALSDRLAAAGAVSVLDPVELLCNDRICPAVIDNVPQYTDETHLVEDASIRAGVIFDQATTAAEESAAVQ